MVRKADPVTQDGGESAPISNKTAPFRWTAQRERAAVLLAEDDLSDAQIAASIGVGRTTLNDWKRCPEFAARVETNVAGLAAAMMRHSVAKRRHRMRTLNDLHDKALDVIRLRAERYGAVLGDDTEAVAIQAARAVSGPSVPGEAATGVLAEKETVNNAGFRTVEWSVDAALLREIRAIQEQAAKELGQWSDKANLNVSGGLVREYVVVRSDPAPHPVGFDDLDDEPGA